VADGISTANANSALGTWTGSANYISLAIGPPGSAGTANPSSVTTREAVTWGSASGGVIDSSNEPEWTAWAGSDGEVVTDIAFWSLITAGTFELSMQLNSSVTMDTGDSLTLTSISITIPTAS
jgi:hypothetical protein